MGRWEPDAVGRLRAAAVDLYVEKGFDQATVTDIAERAGVTPRTFFRYFADKREVLFSGSVDLQKAVVTALEEAPETATPYEAVWAALEAASTMIGQNHDWSRMRNEIIMANAELQERELIKLAALAAAMAEGLRVRGVKEPDASLTAEVGIAVFRVAFGRWVAGPANRKLTRTMRQCFDRARALI
ncbi:MAG: regulatory protein TetR [Frankiales bacterium]|nr:regulatory protein TetR [Frankiales bacterium]